MRHKTKNTVSSSGRPTECSPNPPTTHSAKLPTTTSGEDRPTLLQLICFPFQRKTINIVQMIGADYFDLGVGLLQDETGAIMNSLVKQHRENAIDINRQVLIKWLNGEGKHPVSWATLATELERYGHVTLASKIRSVKVTNTT